MRSPRALRAWKVPYRDKTALSYWPPTFPSHSLCRGEVREVRDVEEVLVTCTE